MVDLKHPVRVCIGNSIIAKAFQFIFVKTKGQIGCPGKSAGRNINGI